MSAMAKKYWKADYSETDWPREPFERARSSSDQIRACHAAVHMSPYGPSLRRRQAKLARSVGASPTQVMPSRQPGSECCVSRRRRRPRSVHSGCVGCVIEPRNGYVAGAETVQSVERNTDRAAKRGHAACRGRRADHAQKDRVGTWEIPRSARAIPLLVRIGKGEPKADDERTREVGPSSSSCEAGEQGGAIRRGAGGAKGWDQGECEPAAHGPDAEPGNRITGAGAHTSNRRQRFAVTHPR